MGACADAFAVVDGGVSVEVLTVFEVAEDPMAEVVLEVEVAPVWSPDVHDPSTDSATTAASHRHWVMSAECPK